MSLHEGRYLSRARIGARMQTRDRAQLVRVWSVLTHFPLAGKRSDRDFDPDNGAQHSVDALARATWPTRVP